MLYTIETNKSMEQVDKDLHTAASAHKFGILHIHDLKATMNKKGVDFERECRIYEVCNPHQAKKVLDAKMEISTALPCRISVYTDGNKVLISTLKPTEMMQIFEVPELSAVAKEVESDMMSMMREAARD